MRYGLFTMPLDLPGKHPNRAYSGDIELSIRSNDLGFTGAWIGEDLTAQWENVPDAF